MEQGPKPSPPPVTSSTPTGASGAMGTPEPALPGSIWPAVRTLVTAAKSLGAADDQDAPPSCEYSSVQPAGPAAESARTPSGSARLAVAPQRPVVAK